MAKELPYFKFEPSAWDTGKIQMCAAEVRGIYIDLCSMYWQRLGDLPYKLALQKVCGGNATALDSLRDEGVIKVKGDAICIDFLNEQLAEFENVSSKNAENARLGWEKRRKDATALPSDSDRSAIREEEIREEERKEEKSKVFGATKVATKTTIEDRQKELMQKLAPFVDQYGKEMLREFFNYWTEMNPGGKKMRFEMQKVFDPARRLVTWSKNNKFKNNGVEGITGQQQRANAIIAAKFAAKETGS